MGLTARLKQVTKARVEAFLDRAEDPATVFPRLVNELGAQIQALKHAEAKAMSAVKSAQRKLDEVSGREARLEKGAELALKLGDEQTAREALTVQVKLAGVKTERARAVEQAEKDHEEALRTRLRMEALLEDLKSRAGEYACEVDFTRALPHNRRQQRTQVSLLDAVARMEGRLDEVDEGYTQRMAQSGLTLERKLRLMERQRIVEQRLQALKQGC